MKYISIQDLIGYGKELRFQLEEQMAKVYEELPSTEIIRCKNCKWWERKYPGSSYGYCHACKHNSYSGHWEIHITRTYNEDFFCADGDPKEEEEEE